MKELFEELYWAETESAVDGVISRHADIFEQKNWVPYGKTESNFSVIENQQGNPVAALIEKLTNSIDAILMKRCYQEGIDPRSENAPRSIEQAVEKFFPDNKNWDLSKDRLKQSKDIQVLAHGPRRETSLVIYDDGEGQRPEDFNDTLLSLLRGNKNDILFVQGKYNMGGSGAIAFCGKKRYQLVASKRYDGSGNFGFTLCRKHPLSKGERVKNTWYEYLEIDGEIPNFPITATDLGLCDREFTTGTIIKLYSYALPSGSRSVISRDLNQSLNEYLFEPALPVCTIDSHKRYPDDRNVVRSLYGLKRRLEDEENEKYLYDKFSESSSDKTGELKITCYVFKFRIEGKTAKDSKNTTRREFFKNNMSVLFSLNGQVHASYTYEFISRALQWSLLKNHLLIHADCSNLDQTFRNELFMASRDRPKEGDESAALRKRIKDILLASRLKEIYKTFKNEMTSSSNDGDDLLKDFSKNLPLNPELTKLLKQTFKLDDRSGEKGKASRKKKNEGKDSAPFNPKRHPATFKIKIKQKDDGGFPLVKLPKNGERIVKFDTDVENNYFDRNDDPGNLHIALLSYKKSRHMGERNVLPDTISAILSVSQSSPSNGIIRIHIKASRELSVGDTIKIQATLSSPGGDLEEIFMVKVEDPECQQPKQKEESPDQLGLPEYEKVREKKTDGYAGKTWDDLDMTDWSYDKVMYPLTEGDKLICIYINMDSKVLKDYTRNLKNEEEIDYARKRYISTIYFHTLFLYTITKNRKYQITRENENEPVDLQDYLEDIFSNYYSAFLLNFGMNDLKEMLAD